MENYFQIVVGVTLISCKPPKSTYVMTTVNVKNMLTTMYGSIILQAVLQTGFEDPKE